MKKPALAIKAAGSVPAETMGKQLLQQLEGWYGMAREECCAEIQSALEDFCIEGKVITYSKYGNGHIHDTFLVQCQSENNSKKYILQRINHEVFAEPERLMDNIVQITGLLKKRIMERGGDPNRETLNPVLTKENRPYFKDGIGCYWRMYEFIEDATSFDQVDSKEVFYESAVLFGNFQSLLSHFDASKLYETIPDFHNTPVRYYTFLEAVKEDVCGRAAFVQKEIGFFIRHKRDMEICAEKLEKGELPLRVIHNDTKLNNIMIDNETGKGICVIDLDTVMPGLAIYDFGDSIRFGANTAAEDELDLTKVSLDLELFELYVKGYLEGCKGSLTNLEIEMLPYGAKTMTLECGMRFLTDYLQGDQYFRIHRENHNLDRCRTQIALAEDMEKKWNEMQNIVSKYR